MFLKSYLEGILAYMRAVKMVKEHKLYLYFIVPIAFIILVQYSGSQIFDQLKEINIGFIYEVEYLDLNSTQLQNILYFALNLLLVFILINFWSYIVLFCMIPLNTYMSMKTDSILTTNKFPFSWPQLLEDIKRSAIIIFRNMVIWLMLVFAIQLLMDVLISVTAVKELDYINLVAIQLVGFYFYGYSLMDYTLERFRMSVEESNVFVWKNKFLAMGVGTVYGLMFQIPYIGNYVGVILGPILGVIAATIALHKVMDLSSNKFVKTTIEQTVKE